MYDFEQACDALWLEDTLNDLYDYLLDQARDDKLALVYQTKTTNLILQQGRLHVLVYLLLSNRVVAGARCSAP